MTTDMQLALELLMLGMFTVFLILSLVVLSARLLILAVNKWSAASLRSRSSEQKIISPPLDTIPKEVIAVLTASVEVATQGQGRIVSIERQIS